MKFNGLESGVRKAESHIVYVLPQLYNLAKVRKAKGLEIVFIEKSVFLR